MNTHIRHRQRRFLSRERSCSGPHPLLRRHSYRDDEFAVRGHWFRSQHDLFAVGADGTASRHGLGSSESKRTQVENDTQLVHVRHTRRRSSFVGERQGVVVLKYRYVLGRGGCLIRRGQ